MTIQPIYLDYHSTTPVDPRVAELMVYYLTTAFGNASSIDHTYGDEAEKAVYNARQAIAQLIKASPKDIIFTSGATESINLAIIGHIQAINSPKLPRIAVSPVEHKAVLDTIQMLAKKGQAELIYLKVDGFGRLDLENLENTCADGLSLLCVMAANNEIGNIYPIEKIGQIAHQYDIPFLCDASQAVGKIPINFNDWGITYLAISAHKLYGPKGVGALVVRKGYPLEPIIFGGGHQKGLRSGTLNVPGIVGLGEACRLRQLEMEQDEQQIARQRDRLQTLLQAQIPDLQVNGNINARLAGNLHISLPGIPNSAIIARVRHQLAISTGAACSSGVATPSHVLRALKLSDEMIEGALRIGVGKFTTDEDIEKAANILTVAVEKIRPYLS
ncbi:aminotransferase, class V (plasmid) [Crocosphaera subtropica ATCC 51142]|uniref:Aminotransferase, class V n=1 Tax=Crocosphaera subtropica (strain ATCC 51142 / BH68) TaxID=43989 RepID=B1X369_CROS5|nr:cysteine desulfurase family protein [Crocosphaera subtropica]ACB54580.1 aminotransferase, class V [Crocosphaera subtropica ATCC 51142]